MEKDKSKIKKEEKELKECERLKQNYLAGWKRTQADFLNYQKKESERIKELIKYSDEEIILKILPILDNIYIAENQVPKEFKENLWVRGFLQIKNQILDFLKIKGVEEIKSLGQNFDPNFHEVIAEIENKNKESGTIVEEIAKGYFFNNKVIRPVRVKIVK